MLIDRQSPKGRQKQGRFKGWDWPELPSLGVNRTCDQRAQKTNDKRRTAGEDIRGVNSYYHHNFKSQIYLLPTCNFQHSTCNRMPRLIWLRLRCPACIRR
jgi:hypothetical protein